MAQVAANKSALWINVEELIERRKAPDYNEAVKLIQQLRQAAEQFGDPAEFTEKATQIAGKYRRRSSLMTKLKKARLID
ncbi:MAG: hypothetical protein AAGN35_12630 [Bacteroidota bacterium]